MAQYLDKAGLEHLLNKLRIAIPHNQIVTCMTTRIQPEEYASSIPACVYSDCGANTRDDGGNLQYQFLLYGDIANSHPQEYAPSYIQLGETPNSPVYPVHEFNPFDSGSGDNSFKTWSGSGLFHVTITIQDSGYEIGAHIEYRKIMDMKDIQNKLIAGNGINISSSDENIISVDTSKIQEKMHGGSGIDIIDGKIIQINDDVSNTLDGLAPTIINHYPPVQSDMQGIIDAIEANKRIKFVKDAFTPNSKEYWAFGETIQAAQNYILTTIELDDGNNVTRYKFENNNNKNSFTTEPVVKSKNIQVATIVGTQCFEFNKGKFTLCGPKTDDHSYDSYNIKSCTIDGNTGWVNIDLEFLDMEGVDLSHITAGMIMFQQLDAYNQGLNDGHKTMPNMNIGTLRVINNTLHIGCSPTVPERLNTNLFKFSMSIFAPKTIKVLV